MGVFEGTMLVAKWFVARFHGDRHTMKAIARQLKEHGIKIGETR